MDYPLLSMITTGIWLLMFTGVFIAFGWCDPNEYKRKIGVDIFSGIMFFTCLRVLSKFSDIMYASVTPSKEGDPLISISALQEFAEGFYAQFNLDSFFDQSGNELTALIIIGLTIMLILIVSVLSIVFGIYFIFRMCVLIDVYVNNIIRYSIMGVTFVLMLIVGIPAGQPRLLIISIIVAVASILKLAVGHALLYFKGDNLRTTDGKKRPVSVAGAQTQPPQQITRRPQQPAPTQQSRVRQHPPVQQNPQRTQHPAQQNLQRPNNFQQRIPQQRPPINPDFAEQLKNMSMRHEKDIDE